MKAAERLLRYVVINTPSDESSPSAPSSECQFDLAHVLVSELKELGVSDAEVSDTCVVYGHIPASPSHEEDTPIGFIAHMDTVECDHQVKPVITENYDGNDLPLGTSGRVLSCSMFPHLAGLKGRTLITSDGTTILGADDKAGVAEIMTMIEVLMNGEIPHGPISIAFTPDEEVGRGTVNFDVKRFGARYAYTVDGDVEGGVEYETFNAAQAKVYFHGVDVHPGSAKDTMINASRLAMEYDRMLPDAERPETTEGYQGFYGLMSLDGDVGSAVSTYIIRDHDKNLFVNRQNFMRDAAEKMNKRYSREVVTIDIRLQYKNMAEVIEQNRAALDYAIDAVEICDLEPVVKPVRGGTDGSNLSYMGLPCPNLGTGGHSFHGPYEHITVEAMDKVVEILLAIVQKYAAR